MSCTRITVCALALLALLQIDNASGGESKGCVWSGCKYTSGCLTDLTGGSGRSKFIVSTKCGTFGGRRAYCCDPNCFHRECGKSCSQLGLDGSFDGAEDNTHPVDCSISVNFPGVGDIQVASKHRFCCG